MPPRRSKRGSIYPFLGWLALVSISFMIFSTWHSLSRRTVLYTAPHAEFAPFQRIWNPPESPNDDEAQRDSGDEGNGDDEIVTDDIAGEDGKYSDVNIPAFNGEDYFDNTPIG